MDSKVPAIADSSIQRGLDKCSLTGRGAILFRQFITEFTSRYCSTSRQSFTEGVDVSDLDVQIPECNT